MSHSASSALDTTPVIRAIKTIIRGHVLVSTESGAAGFVRMAVEEFGVQPVVADWLERLAADSVLS